MVSGFHRQKSRVRQQLKALLFEEHMLCAAFCLQDDIWMESACVCWGGEGNVSVPPSSLSLFVSFWSCTTLCGGSAHNHPFLKNSASWTPCPGSNWCSDKERCFPSLFFLTHSLINTLPRFPTPGLDPNDADVISELPGFGISIRKNRQPSESYFTHITQRNP